MAIIHKATLEPTKIELLTRWLPLQSWYDGRGPVQKIASYRFDDPDGEVGMEGFLLHVGTGEPLHLALTYRAAPLPGSDDYLLGTTEHSVLGPRYVYEAGGDPVWVAAVTQAIVTGADGAESVTEVDGRRVVLEQDMTVRGTGSASGKIDLDAYELIMVRIVGERLDTDDQLVGSWSDRTAALAGVRSVTGQHRHREA
jgi:hypothetical protein